MGSWEPHRDTISLSRLYLSDRPELQLVGGVAPQGLLSLPALLMPEVNPKENQIARVATITSAKASGKDVNFEYVFDAMIPPIPVSKVVELASQLEIATDGFMLQHTHWTVNDADLFRVLFRNDIGKAAKPKLFTLDAHEADPELVGVMMPFDARFNPVYEAITTAATALELRAKRADDIWIHSQVIQDIVSLICQSGVIIADCTGRNPNVFYEIGIAHMLGREVILITQDIKDVPFDLQYLRALVYLPNQQGFDDLTEKLKTHLHTLQTATNRI